LLQISSIRRKDKDREHARSEIGFQVKTLSTSSTVIAEVIAASAKLSELLYESSNTAEQQTRRRVEIKSVKTVCSWGFKKPTVIFNT
jgi:hypothetical protein